MWYVYILESITTKELYKGITNNLYRRLKQHDSGQSKSTSGKRPLKLIHVEICMSRESARRLEKYFKTGYGREILYQISDEQAAVVEWQTRRT